MEIRTASDGISKANLMQLETKRLYSSKELSKATGIPVYTILKLTREGKIPAYKIMERGYLYDLDEVIDAIKKYRA